MTERFVCARCGEDFESAEARCPKCLRKSSVQSKGSRSAGSDVAQLATGDHSQTSAGRRAMALVASITLSAVLGALVLLVWDRFVSAGIVVPTLAACGVAVGLWVRAALLDGDGDARTWSAFARRCAIGGGLGGWAFVCGVTGLVATNGLSIFFAIALGVVLFLGGLIPIVRWMRHAEAPAAPPAGKWR